MSLKTWEINGQSLELDLEDVESLERYEDAFVQMAEEEKAIPKDGKKSAAIRAYCELFPRLYDRIFGSGTSEKIFEGVRMNAAAYDEIYLSFLEFVRNQSTQNTTNRRNAIQKYLPKNRQQRRAVQK